jgi:CBS domain containing-hemolysin-like protein
MFSFMCSVAESVFLSISIPFIKSVEKKNLKMGKMLKNLKLNPNRPLAAILSLNTIAHTVGAAGAGAQAAIVFGDKYIGLISAVLTFLILVFSEIIPKTIGTVYWRQLSTVTAYFIKYLTFILYPFVLLSEFVTRSFSGKNKSDSISREEFVAMAETDDSENPLFPEESKILKNLFNLEFYKAEDIMTPRTVLFTLPASMQISEFKHKHMDAPHSRIPIYIKNQDNIVGFVLKTDILTALVKNKTDNILEDFKREIKVYPENVSLIDLYNYMEKSKKHIVLIVDEYGGTTGIVTMEDVLETLIGSEIIDEEDKDVDMRAVARSLWQKRARKLGLIKKRGE